MAKKNFLLTKKELEKCLKEHKGWSVNSQATQLSKMFHFPDYMQALVFVARVSVHAEVLKHHPDIELSYGKVKIKLQTHELKGLTKVDIALLERIERISDCGV